MAAVVADDVQIQAVGSAWMVAKTISGAFQLLAKELKDAALPLAMHKLCLLTTSKELATAIGTGEPGLSTSRVWQARNLGMDLSCAKTGLPYQEEEAAE
eukprot:6941984-Heterocapsa_arctica.AAC.1